MFSSPVASWSDVKKVIILLDTFQGSNVLDKLNKK